MVLKFGERWLESCDLIRNDAILMQTLENNVLGKMKIPISQSWNTKSNSFQNTDLKKVETTRFFRDIRSPL